MDARRAVACHRRTDVHRRHRHPEAQPTDVLVRVKACGIVPNMANVINNWPTWFPHQPLPRFPAIFGLDAAGVVEEVGEAVIGNRPGDRVYVNPLRSVRRCYSCRGGDTEPVPLLHPQRLLQHLPRRPEDLRPLPLRRFLRVHDRAPGLAGQAAGQHVLRAGWPLGYIGTSYGALRMADAGPGMAALIDGITGTLASPPPSCAWPWGLPGFSAPDETRSCSSGSRRLRPTASRFSGSARSRPVSGPRP